MTNAYPAKVNRTINYKTTIGGVVRWRPAVITAVTDANTCNARVGHHGETYNTIVRRNNGDMKWNLDPPPRTDLNKWRPG